MARNVKHYPRGTKRGGQFMPKVGADLTRLNPLAAVARKRRAAQLRSRGGASIDQPRRTRARRRTPTPGGTPVTTVTGQKKRAVGVDTEPGVRKIVVVPKTQTTAPVSSRRVERFSIPDPLKAAAEREIAKGGYLGDAEATKPEIEEGFQAWIDGEAYLDNRGSYRLKSNKRKIAAWSKAVKAAYPDNQDFHRAARDWNAKGPKIGTGYPGQMRPPKQSDQLPLNLDAAAGRAAESKGHIDYIGRFEYLVGPDGDLYRAPRDAPIDTSTGYRVGARFESKKRADNFEAHLKPVRDREQKSIVVELDPEVFKVVKERNLDAPEQPKGEVAQRIFGDAADTQELFSTETDGKRVYTAERKKLHDKIVAAALAGAVKPTGKPHMLFMGGGSGSGKSTAMARLEEEGAMPASAVTIDADAIKEQLPEFAEMAAAKDTYSARGAHEESSDIAKRIQAEAQEAGFNIVLDGTADNPKPEKFQEKLDKAAAKGYDVDVVVVNAPTGEAIERAIRRAERSGRYVPIPEMRKIHKAVSANHYVWKDSPNVKSWRVYDNGGEGPPVLAASRDASGEQIHDPERYNEFTAKREEDLKAEIAALTVTDEDLERARRALGGGGAFGPAKGTAGRGRRIPIRQRDTDAALRAARLRQSGRRGQRAGSAGRGPRVATLAEEGPGGIGTAKPPRRSGFVWVKATPKRKGHWRRRRPGETRGAGGGRVQIGKAGLPWGGRIFKSTKDLRAWIEERGGSWEKFKTKFPAAHEGLLAYERGSVNKFTQRRRQAGKRVPGDPGYWKHHKAGLRARRLRRGQTRRYTDEKPQETIVPPEEWIQWIPPDPASWDDLEVTYEGEAEPEPETKMAEFTYADAIEYADVVYAAVPNFALVGAGARGKLAPLMAHYGKMAHPFTACVADNTKRFGPERAKRVCAVLKDLIKGTTKWRKGGKAKAYADFEAFVEFGDEVDDEALDDFARWLTDADIRHLIRSA